MSKVTLSERINVDEFTRKYKHLIDIDMEFLPNIGETIQINDNVYAVREKLFHIKFDYHSTEPESQEINLYLEQLNY
jgi:hypothetical protein